MLNSIEDSLIYVLMDVILIFRYIGLCSGHDPIE